MGFGVQGYGGLAAFGRAQIPLGGDDQGLLCQKNALELYYGGRVRRVMFDERGALWGCGVVRSWRGCTLCARASIDDTDVHRGRKSESQMARMGQMTQIFVGTRRPPLSLGPGGGGHCPPLPLWKATPPRPPQSAEDTEFLCLCPFVPLCFLLASPSVQSVFLRLALPPSPPGRGGSGVVRAEVRPRLILCQEVVLQ